MDPMESMSVSGGRVPAGFNAEDAGNMEDVGYSKSLSKRGMMSLLPQLRAARQCLLGARMKKS